MPRDDSVYLQHIFDAITRIESYLDQIDEDMFHATPLLQDGVIRQIEIIGEATKHLSPAITTQHLDVPWSDLARMRDKLIHQYFGVDLTTVWLTATEDLPTLKIMIEEIIVNMGPTLH